MLPTADAFATAVGALGIGDGMTIVVYDSVSLFSAPRVRWTFRVFGASDVRILAGGLPRWIAEGRPIEEGPVTRAPRRFTPRLDHGAVATLDDLRKALAERSAQVVDARSRERFRGEAPEPRPGLRSGHMPGSLNLPFGELIAADGTLKPRAELLAILSRAGIDPERPVITTCGSGVTAAIVSLALEETGHPARALYDGAWAEWGRARIARSRPATDTIGKGGDRRAGRRRPAEGGRRRRIVRASVACAPYRPRSAGRDAGADAPPRSGPRSRACRRR